MSSYLDIQHLPIKPIKPIKIVDGYSDRNVGEWNSLRIDDKSEDHYDNNDRYTSSSGNHKQGSDGLPSKHQRFVWKVNVDRCVCEPQITYTNTVHESPILAHNYPLHDVFIRDAYFHPRYRLYATYRIVNYTKFIESLYYFIASEYLVFPREFETPEWIHDETNTIMCGLDNHERHTSVAAKVNKAAGKIGIAHDDDDLGEYDTFCEPILNLRKALIFDKRSGKLSRCSCPDKGALPREDVDHPHSSSDRFVMFCSEPEIAAALYVNVVTNSRERYRLLRTLKIWLAEVSVDSVAFVLHNSFARECEQAMIVTELEPAYTLHFLYSDRYCLLNNTNPDCESVMEQCDARRIKRLAVYTVKHNDEYIESCKLYDIHSIRYSEDFDSDIDYAGGNINDSGNGSTANYNNRQQPQKQINKNFTGLLVDHWRHEDVYSLRNRRDNIVLVMRKQRQRSRSGSRSGSSTRSGGTQSRSRSRSPSPGQANKRKLASSNFKAGGGSGGRRRSRSRSRSRSK